MHAHQAVRHRPLIGWDTVHHCGLSHTHGAHQAGTKSSCPTITTISNSNCGSLCMMGKPHLLILGPSAPPTHLRQVKRCLTGVNMYWYWAPPHRYMCIVNFPPFDTVIFAPDTALSIQLCTVSWDSGSRGWITPAAPITENMQSSGSNG